MIARKKTFVTAALAGLVMACLPALAQDSRPGAVGAQARQGDPYLLAVCPVSGEPLEGEPVVKIHEGRELRFCCGGCAKKLAKDPEGVIAKADKLIIERQSRYYPTKTCVVSDEPLEGKPVDVVYMNRLVRLCCKGCKRGFAKDPKAVVAKLDKLVMEHQREHYPLDACPVSNEPVDRGAVEVVYGNRYMRFCCKRCVRSFEKNPTAHVAKLDKAWAAMHAEHGHAGEHGKGHDHGSTVGGGG